MTWLKSLLERAPWRERVAPAAPSPDATHLAVPASVESDIDRAERQLFEQERLLQHARRRLADLGVTLRMLESADGHSGRGQAPRVDPEVLVFARAELRVAVDSAALRISETRTRLHDLRARLASATARLELQSLMDEFDAASSEVRAALGRADQAVMRVEARAMANEELDDAAPAMDDGDASPDGD